MPRGRQVLGHRSRRAAEPMGPCQQVGGLHLQAGESPHQPPAPVNGARRQTPGISQVLPQPLELGSLREISSKTPQSDGNVLQFEDEYLVKTFLEGNDIRVIPYKIRILEDGVLFVVDSVNSNALSDS
ncbi:hypothetical protein EV2_021267 [Malus domestica]